MRSYVSLLLLGATAAGLTVGSGASAQTSEAGASVSEVVVTAQKREERLVEVPISISVVSAESLAAVGGAGVRDLAVFTPGLTVTHNTANYTPTIRGIASLGTSAGDEQAVGVYVDDAYAPATFSGFANLLDIDRIEVLKGPQGTLFGRNAIAGAIRIVTKDPGHEPTATLRGDYGFNYSTVRLNGYGSLPLGDKAGVSLAAMYNHEGPYLKDLIYGGHFGKVEEKAFRGKFVVRPTDDFKFALTGDYSRSDNPAGLSRHFYQGRTSLSALPGVIFAREVDEIGSSSLPVYVNNNRGLTAVATWDVGDFQLKSISAIRRTRLEFNADGDLSSLPSISFLAGQGWDTKSQEFNISGDLTPKLHLLGGFYYYDADAFVRISVGLGDYGTPNIIQNTRSGVHTKSYAAFGGFTYDVTDRISVDLQARYTDETKRYFFNNLLNAADAPRDKHKWTNPTYRAVARYKPTKDSQFYVNYSTGFKSGVYNTSTNQKNFVNPEHIYAWEVGYKASLPGGALLSVAAYRYRYRDLQFQLINTTGGFGLVLQNAARAKIEGLEGSFSTPVGDSFHLDAGASWQPTAKYARFPAATVNRPLPNGGTVATPTDVSGTRMVQSPKLTANLGVRYQHDLMAGDFSAIVQAAYNSGYWLQVGPRIRQGDYTTVNAEIGWGPQNQPWRVSLWAQNLLDNRVGISSTSSGVGDSMANTRGIEGGVGAQLKF